MAIKSEIKYNDGLDTWLKRFSTRNDADYIATCIRETGLEARVHDRNWETGAPRVPRNERYEILVRSKDYTRAFSLATHFIQQRKEWK